eukprot:gene3971-7912_t
MNNDFVFIQPVYIQSVYQSGANGSGKSVYLKQVGVLVYLAHIGSWLPCERAVIGLTDRIFTRISSVESVSTPQSAFALDLAQFGKGTAPLDGIALLAATVKHFATHPAKVIFVLHFTEILHENVLPTEVKTSMMTFRMETHTSDDNGDGTGLLDEEDGDPTPLFVLKVGVAPSSGGIPCARLAGVPEQVLERAVAVRSAIAAREPLRPATLHHHSNNNNTTNQQQQSHMNIQQSELLKLFLAYSNWERASTAELIDFKTHLAR